MSPKELIVISGKGGTGKTSIVAAFAALAGRVVLADCDVDAADLHLVLHPKPGPEHRFSGRNRAVIDSEACTACGRCADVCRYAAVLDTSRSRFTIDAVACEGCGLCTRVCPAEAVRMEPVVNGVWIVSDTDFGPLVHARLGIAEDNSGKLVTRVRAEGRRVAHERGLSLVIVDGSPGIGCPVIASMAGADLVLVVTEPTVSGRHDLERVVSLARRFGLPFGVCVNKVDLHATLGARIRDEAMRQGAAFVSSVVYDPAVTHAQIVGTDMITHGGRAADDVTMMWNTVEKTLAEAAEGVPSHD